ncbi:Type 1 glutamine amidotransferase-like domain-containing protein [Microbacterium jejuense]|uniref:Type 1 glutamine amidotransferase-like domain-containing protein n=1 Tax=Microbacterium jejuense TaxID=1263637 RepID=UPI0031EBF8B6
MKFLLTSGGVRNPSIGAALVEMLGKPIAEASALIVPTGIHPFASGAAGAFDAITGTASSPLAGLGWASLGVLELTALPTIRPENWVPQVRAADALLVWGGDVLYLCQWMRESGLADLLPTLDDTVYVGVSAGSIAVTPYNCDAEFDRQFAVDGADLTGADRGLGLIDVTLYPHLNDPGMADTTLENITAWAAGIPVPTYAIDDDTALTVVDGVVNVVSEGRWHLLGG